MLDKIKSKIFFSRRKSYKEVFESEAGKYVLADLYKFCGMDKPSYMEGSPDRTAYNEGLKRVGLRIKAILKHSDEELENIAKQYNNNQINQPRGL